MTLVMRGFKLIMGSDGKLTTNEDCCCDDCGIAIASSLSGGNIVVTAFYSGTYDFLVTKNGVTHTSITGTSGLQSVSIAVVAGDVIFGSADGGSGCYVETTCERYGYSASCEYLDFTGYGGECLPGGPNDYLVANTTRSATISGLLGPMAALNGSYSIGCAAPNVLSTVSWTGSGAAYNFGSVRGVWTSEYSYFMQITSSHSDGDSCILSGTICNPTDPTTFQRSRTSTRSESLSIVAVNQQDASCSSCYSANYSAPSDDGFLNTSNGASCSPASYCALDGTITWTA